MKKSPLSCEQIDREELVEQYASGNMPAILQKEFEQHLDHCEVHANAVLFERSIKRGVRAYAREELKKRISLGNRKIETTRILILRFAAIFLAVILTPILLFYMFYEGRPVELAQKMDVDSSQIVSAPMKESVIEEKNSMLKSEKKEIAEVTRFIPETIAGEEENINKIELDDIPMDEKLMTAKDESNGQGVGAGGVALINSKAKMLSSSGRGEVAAPVSFDYVVSDTCLKESVYQQILRNHESELQEYYYTLDAPATRIDFTFTILPAGSVENIYIHTISQSVPILEDSLKKSLQKLTFPKNKDTCKISKTYLFEK